MSRVEEKMACASADRLNYQRKGEMKFNREVAHYVVRFHNHLMTEEERQAQRHLFFTMKATGSSDAEAQEEAQNSKVYSESLCDDPEVLRLAGDGHEAFEQRVAKRILEEHGDKVLLNCCPKCAQLARTPTARQCRFCGYDWHEDM